MFEKIIRFAIEQRWIVLLAVLGMAGLGYTAISTCPLMLCRTLPMCKCKSIRQHPVIHRWRLNSG